MNGSGGGGMEKAADTSPLRASTSVILEDVDDGDLDVDNDVDDDDVFVVVPPVEELFVSVDDLDLTGLAGTRISSACGFVRMVDGEYVDAGLDFFFFF